MAVVHTLLVRQTIANLVVDLIDAGAGAGNLIFQTAADAEVATLPFSDPAFGAADGSAIATANAITADTTATAGTIEHAKFFDSNSLEVLECSCGIGTGDIQLSSLTIATNDTVSVSNLTYTVP